MSFGPSNTTKTAENNLGGVSNALQNVQFPQLNTAAGNMLNTGAGTTSSGVNFFNTLLNGNNANTTALLQPDIERANAARNNTLSAVNTLTPRGGGRFGANYGVPLSSTGDLINLFNQPRMAAAQQLPQIGLQETGQGANLFNLANSALTGSGAVNTNLAQIGQQQQQISNQLFGGIGQTLMGLALAPTTGGGSLFGNIFH